MFDGNCCLINKTKCSIMDSTTRYFLRENLIRGLRFLDGTCNVLLWVLSYFDNTTKPDRMIVYEIAKFPIVSGIMTGAQDSTSTRCALGTSSRMLRILRESVDVIRYVFLLSAGLRPSYLTSGLVVNPFSLCSNSCD